MTQFESTDIFCRVIDNFGDAGVCWRLARRLLSLGVKRIRFITDHPEVLAKLAPDAEKLARGVPWDSFALEAQKPGFEPADLVIETFGCRLPESYDEALARKRALAIAAGQRPPFYFNLDYLSAEDWVEESHNITGLHPRLNLPKLWFFPGFTDRTGGLLIEDDYEAEKESFMPGKKDFLASLHADPELPTLFVFCYPVNRVEALAKGLALSDKPWNVLIAPGEAGDKLEGLLKTINARGDRIRAVRTPFLPQTEFDRLLWASDAGIIRGEDSFVRAQLAGLPFLWSTYPTEDHAHRVKLDAWLDRFVPELPASLAERYRATSVEWLEGALSPEGFRDFLEFAPMLRPALAQWQRKLLSRGDLARHMLERAQNAL